MRTRRVLCIPMTRWRRAFMSGGTKMRDLLADKVDGRPISDRWMGEEKPPGHAAHRDMDP